MERLLAIVRSFWFCLAMASWSLISMAGELMEGEDPWFSVIVVMLWVFLGWRSIQRSKEEDSGDGED
jgi:hypothetical protein